MALNKFMHPRNIYRSPPNFVVLAKSFDEFNKISKMDVTGKVTIDFKDPHSLRVLTKCLLKKDFNLDVIIPEDRLVPTLPLRLNYILWVEDLMLAIGRKDDIRGLDVGTGACAIYPLLAAVMNNWRMVGTESDEVSLQKAQENVQRNNLTVLIQLRKSPSKSLLGHLFADENAAAFDFSMCNPPFYSNVQELCESRSPARLPPKNAFTGSPQELITDGGELTFCRKMIEESKSLQDKVLIFTTMVGHKYNLKELEQDLRAEGIRHTTTEFCQGRVTRWGLAWTHQDFDIAKLVPPRDKARKPNVPMLYALPEIPGIPYDTDNISKKIKTILQTLNITYKVLNKRGHQITMNIVAMTNTWSSQRRKRRLMKRLEGSDCKRTKLNGSSSEEHSSQNVSDVISETTKTKDESERSSEPTKTKDEPERSSEPTKTKDEPESSSEPTKTKDEPEISEPLKTKDEPETNKDEVSNCHSSQDEAEKFNNKDVTEPFSVDETETSGGINENHDIEVAHNSNAKENLTISNTTNDTGGVVGTSATGPVVQAILKILKREKEIFLEIEFLDGNAGKEGMHQIVQYIKNNWK